MCVFNFKSVVKTSMKNLLSLVLQNRNSEVKRNTYVIFTSQESLLGPYCSTVTLMSWKRILQSIRAAELNQQLVLEPAMICNLKHCSNSVSNRLLN